MEGQTAPPRLPYPADPAVLAAWAFVGLGVLLRLARYLLHFPLWGDETMLAVNFLDRDFAGLVQPLDYGQVCPLLFLWLELAAVRLLGFSEWSLRLAPALFSLASLLVFRSLAARLLRGWPYALAVGVFAVSYFIVRHGAEAKPYAGDLLAALVLLWLAARWIKDPSFTRPLWVLAFAAPLCLGLSFTTAMVFGGVSLVLLPTVWRQKRVGVWAAYLSGILSFAIAGSVLYVVHIGPLFAATRASMVGHHWKSAFPPLDQPLALLVWLVQTHSGRMLAYPLGSQNAGSAGTLLLCLVGLAMLWRQRRRDVIALCLAPLAMGLLAAALRRYPYGDSTRTMQYVAPAACLLAGLGLATLIAWAPVERRQRHALAASLSLLALLGGGLLCKDLVQPYKHPRDDVNRQFARWFWRDNAVGAEVACAERDLGLEIDQIGRTCSSPEYFCNQRIYSRHSGRREEPHWARITNDHPLRVVLHMVEGDRRDDRALDAWLADLQTRRQLALAGVDRYRLNVGTGEMHGRLIEVFQLVPRNSLQASQPLSPASLR
jgi:hypothetical protein